MLTHLADVTIRSLLLIAIAAIALLVLRKRRSPALQHAIWTAVVLGMLALFTLGETLPRLPLRVLNPTTSQSPAAQTIAINEFVTPAESSVPPAPTPIPHHNVDWTTLATDLYAIVAAVFAIRFLFGMFLVRRLLAQSTPLESFHESALIGIPVTAGWLRPVIILPKEWRDWDRQKLEAVLTHERAHVRRKDGLIAGLAGLNRCLLWFNPLAWWLERRLALLAEQACDEASILALGGSEDDREEYVRLLLDMAATLNTSHGRLRTHVLAMASRSQIRQRVEPLLQQSLTFSKGLTRTASIALAICCVPVIWATGTIDVTRQAAQLHLDVSRFTIAIPKVPEQPHLLAQSQTPSVQPPPAQPAPLPQPEARFDAASIKPVRGAGGGREGPRAGSPLQFEPGRVVSYPEGVTARRLIMDAYGLQPQQISGGPDWLDSDNFYIEAKAADANAGKNQLRKMLQTLLTDRFKLVIGGSTRTMPVYALVAAKNGPTLHEIKEGEVIPPTGKELIALGLMPPMRPGERATGIMRSDDTMDEFAAELSIYPKLDDRPVLNKTGLKGTYLIALVWYADGDITTAMQEMLGLKLESQRASVEVVTIDHIEKPDPN